MRRGMQVGGQPAHAVQSRQVEPVGGGAAECAARLAVDQVHQFGAVEQGGVVAVVVVVEEHPPAVNLPCRAGRRAGYGVVVGAAHLAGIGIDTAKEGGRPVGLHPVGVALVIRLSRHGVHDEHTACRVDHDAAVRVVAVFVGQEHGLAGHAPAAAEHHIALAQLHRGRQDGVGGAAALPACAVGQHGGAHEQHGGQTREAGTFSHHTARRVRVVEADFPISHPTVRFWGIPDFLWWCRPILRTSWPRR